MSKEKLRKFRIQFAIDTQEKVNELMRRMDFFQGINTGVVTTGIVTTANPLPFDEYKKIIAKAFAENGGKLYHIEEIIS